MNEEEKTIPSAIRSYDEMTRRRGAPWQVIIMVSIVGLTILAVVWGTSSCLGEPRPFARVRVNRLERIYREGMFAYTDAGAFGIASGDLYGGLVEGACYDVTVRPNCGQPLLVSATRVACPIREETIP